MAVKTGLDESSTVMVNVKGPVSVGTPDITPAVLRAKPVESAPPASLQLYGPAPPVAVRVCGLLAYKLSLGNEVVDIAKEEVVGVLDEEDTVKLVVDGAVKPHAVTVISPVVAPAGTVVTITVGVQLVTTADVPLKLTALLAGVVLKFIPFVAVMVTAAPTGALVGETETLAAIGDATAKVGVSLLPHPAREKRKVTNTPMVMIL